MPIDIPTYWLAGDQPISLEATVDGGASFKGWDFEKKAMTRQAADWSTVMGFDPNLPVLDQVSQSENGDVVRITKKVFDATIKKLSEG